MQLPAHARQRDREVADDVRTVRLAEPLSARCHLTDQGLGLVEASGEQGEHRAP